MKKISIKIPNNNYDVFVGKNVIDNLSLLLKKKKISGKLFVVVDKNVNKFYSREINLILDNSKFDYKIFNITATEKNKSYETLQKIHRNLIKYKYGRDSLMIAVGGGIIGDITGFAASTFMRGIKYIQVPTTLLSAVDSSVGGKTGINFYNTKNIIGTFYQPEMVLIDTNFFSTLPEKEMLCGIGEIIKYCFLTELKFFNYVKKNIDKLLANDTKTLTKVITEALRFKGDVIIADEKESGLRKILNFGHTFAHAYEVEQNHKIEHGQAVIVGISSALYLSKELSLLKPNKFKEFNSLIFQFKSKVKLGKINKNNVYKIMQRDKKNRDGKIKLVLLKDIGKIVTDVSSSKKMIIDAVDYGTKLFAGK